MPKADITCVSFEKGKRKAPLQSKIPINQGNLQCFMVSGRKKNDNNWQKRKKKKKRKEKKRKEKKRKEKKEEKKEKKKGEKRGEKKKKKKIVKGKIKLVRKDRKWIMKLRM